MAIFGKNHNGVNGAGPHTSTGINTNKSVPVWTLPVRIVQFLFALLVLALCGHAKNYFGDYTISNAYGYGVFAGLFVMACCIYFMVISCVVAAHHPLVVLILDAACLLFTTILWPVLAAFSAKYKTYGLPAYYLDGFYDYLYSYDSTSGWKAGVAAAVFGAFLWLLFILTTVFSLIHGRKAGFGRTGVHNTHGTGMGGVGTAPVYGNNTGMGAPTTGQGYPMDNSMNNQGMGHPGMNQPGMGQPGMGQPAYNTGAPTNMGGYNNAPAYNTGPVHGNPV